ncbi:hypothetical protein Bca52824_076863 [Brassica carinata]|uniref:Uncharacterized protein n=1 Tax=Brassica carinata TaxID=52824 RepID=A0A8X7PSH0_BRACI|nr:hypothetical protein Bca52824_076863 [Brassica carinata]
MGICQRGLIFHPRRFNNAAWKLEFPSSNFSKDCFFLCWECGIDEKIYYWLTLLKSKQEALAPFIPDDVICLLGILTPLPAFGVLFDNEGVKNPVIQSPIGPEEYLK